jgi:hypothetical protein
LFANRKAVLAAGRGKCLKRGLNWAKCNVWLGGLASSPIANAKWF